MTIDLFVPKRLGVAFNSYLRLEPPNKNKTNSRAMTFAGLAMRTTPFGARKAICKTPNENIL
jgi:hypothetical protein